MMPVGERRVLVGDPRAARELLGAAGEPSLVASLPGGPDFSAATLARFDAVAERCEATGYEVVRMPLVPAMDGRTYLTSLNAILDQGGGRRIVYMPIFAGAGALNQTATEIWAKLGYEVRPVDCTSVSEHFGSLRCLVNVLRRGGERTPGQG